MKLETCCLESCCKMRHIWFLKCILTFLFIHCFILLLYFFIHTSELLIAWCFFYVCVFILSLTCDCAFIFLPCLALPSFFSESAVLYLLSDSILWNFKCETGQYWCWMKIIPNPNYSFEYQKPSNRLYLFQVWVEKYVNLCLTGYYITTSVTLLHNAFVSWSRLTVSEHSLESGTV